jgi:hypothetical protein
MKAYSRTKLFSSIADKVAGLAKPRPIRTRPAVKTNAPESVVLRECLAYLTSIRSYYPLTFNRLSNGAGYTAGGFRSFGIRGAGDILAMLDGQHIEIECKSGKGGQLSLDQQQRQRAVEQAGGLYFIVHSREELAAKLEPYLAPLREKSWAEFLEQADDLKTINNC